jgi:AraC family transcriptional regulator of adaptative response/methylated-DNA-[protein]-cysteine methyltransferase
MLDTLRDITIEAEAPEFLDGPTGDYERVRRIIAFISERWRDQPSLEAIAEHVGLSTTHVHHLFRRWCGLTPKAFLAAITLDNAKAVLAPRPACSTLPTRSACRARGACTTCSSPTRR